MTLINKRVFESDGFGVGIHKESGKFCLYISVAGALVDYLEYYEISKVDYESFKSGNDMARLRAFAEACRNNLHADKRFQP